MTYNTYTKALDEDVWHWVGIAGHPEDVYDEKTRAYMSCNDLTYKVEAVLDEEVVDTRIYHPDDRLKYVYKDYWMQRREDGSVDPNTGGILHEVTDYVDQENSTETPVGS